MTRQGKITVIVVAAIHSFGSLNGSVSTNRRHAKITQKIHIETMTLRMRLQVKIYIANVGDCNVAIKTHCAQTQGCCDSGLDVQDFDNC